MHIQSYVTLCDPMDCGSPVSAVHGISQAGTYVYLWLIHVDVWKKKFCKSIILQLKNNFLKKEGGKKIILEWVAIPFSRDLPNPGTEPTCPAWTGRFFTTAPPEKPKSLKIWSAKIMIYSSFSSLHLPI